MSFRSMEASSFLSSKSFSRTLELVPPSRFRSPIVPKKRFGQCLRGIGAGHSCSTIVSCSVGSGLPDNGHEPVIGTDWRSFRARLVSGEQVLGLAGPITSLAPNTIISQIPAPGALGDKWAHPLHEPERGCLLIASEKLDGVHIFERTVILIVSIGPLGPVGIILNRPSLMSIKETRSTDFDIAGTFSDQPLFFGGPLGEGIILVGPQKDNENDRIGKSGVFEEVMKGLYYGTKESMGCAAEMVKRNVVGVGDFRFFDGYCGWEKEQLREEIKDGYWSVVACSPRVVGLASVVLWEEVLGLVGKRKVW